MDKLRFKSGFTTCPACSILGVPQEPYMAVPTKEEPGRVYCYACNHVTSSLPSHDCVAVLQGLPKSVLDAVMALISAPMPESFIAPATHAVAAVGKKGLFSSPMTDYDATRAAGAVAQGNVDVLLEEADRVTISLTHGPYAFHTLRLSYLPRDIEVAEQASECQIARVEPLLDRLPELEARIVASLAKAGFRLGGHDIESSMRFVKLFKGSALKGVSAEVTWIP